MSLSLGTLYQAIANGVLGDAEAAEQARPVIGLDMLSRFRPEMLLAVTPHGTPKQIAQIVKGFVDAGLRVPKILDYGGMAGLKFAASSAQKVREAEDELMKLCGDIA